MTIFAAEVIDLINTHLDEAIGLRSEFMEKTDGSYVSKGDLLISELVKNYFTRHFPTHIFVSEEDFDQNMEKDSNSSYVFVDPIDGTENFVSGLKEWGVGVSVYTSGEHEESLIYLPELKDFHYTGSECQIYKSRIIGLSSSISYHELPEQRYENHEIRIVGCAMYNLLSAARGSFSYFENIKGVNCWDILPGLNIALELGCDVYVNGKRYTGEILFPGEKFKVRVEQKHGRR